MSAQPRNLQLCNMSQHKLREVDVENKEIGRRGNANIKLI